MDHSEREIDGPTAVIASRVRYLRKQRGLSAERLADAMNERGIPWKRAVVAKLETGRRRAVDVAEWLALADALNVAPVHLLIPIDDDEAPYTVTPNATARTGEVRAWVRGFSPLQGTDERLYFSTVPRAEWKSPNSRD